MASIRVPGQRPAGSVTLSIPLPPPLSACFKNARRRGRVKSGIYTAWITESLHKIAMQKPGQVSGCVTLDMTFGRPDKRKRDLDNLLKATCDLMVSAGVIEDDSKVTELTARWSNEITGAVVIVEAV